MELFGLSFTIVGVVQSIACVPFVLFFFFTEVHYRSAVLLFSIPYGGLVGMVGCFATSREKTLTSV
jgi:hypothetical protein